MKLTEVQVHNFKNVLDSTPVHIEPQITCIVGKNESGKTAFLHALYRSNPAYASAKFSVQQHYPAWLEKQHRREGKVLEQSRPVRATFELEATDLSTLESRFGQGTLTSKQVTVEREYSGKAWFTFQTSELNAVLHILRGAKIPADFEESAAKVKTIADVDSLLKGLIAEGGESSKIASETISAAKAKLLGNATDLREAVLEVVSALTPSFFYFDEYSSLPGTIKIRELLSKKKEDLTDDERTARALLDLAGAESEYLLILKLTVKLSDPPELKSVKNKGRELLMSVDNEADSPPGTWKLWKLAIRKFTIKQLKEMIAESWSVPLEQLELRSSQKLDPGTEYRLPKGFSLTWPE